MIRPSLALCRGFRLTLRSVNLFVYGWSETSLLAVLSSILLVSAKDRSWTVLSDLE